MANAPQGVAPAISLRDNLEITETFVDGVAGVLFQSGNLNITFSTLRADHTRDPAPQHRTISTRLVLPLAAAMELQNSIAAIIKDAETKGLISMQR